MFASMSATRRRWCSLLVVLAGVAAALAGARSGATEVAGTVTTFATGLDEPMAIAVDDADNVLVADSWNQRILQITPGGVATPIAGAGSPIAADTSLFLPQGVTVGPSGALFIASTNTHRVFKVVAGVASVVLGDGSSGGGMAQTNYPAGVAVDSAGNLYVADQFNQRVQKVTPAGVVSTAAGGNGYGNGSNQLSYPFGVVVDASDNLYVADTANHRVQKITPGGVVSTVPAGSLSFPRGLALDEAGNLFVADASNNRVQKVTPGGVVSTVAGGNGSGSGANQLFEPNGVALDSAGNLYIADKYNDRVQRVALVGSMTPPTTTTTAPTTTTTAAGVSREITGAFAQQGGIEGAISRLHMAVYRTQPDATEHAAWVAQYNEGVSLLSIAEQFAATSAFSADYGGLSDGAFIAALYRNVLGREGDAPGLRWWAAELQSRPSRSFMLLRFSQTPEFMTLTNTR